MKRLIAVATTVVALALPAAASAGGGYGSQPGYGQASQCGVIHGAFGAFDGEHNIGEYGGAVEYHGGVKGQEVGATGYNNSHTNCQE
jgi:hypothetical protein